jgi:hypothetical protein
MPVLKFGGMSLMIVRVIFGLLVVLFMKWQDLNHHFRAKICRNYSKVFNRQY